MTLSTVYETNTMNLVNVINTHPCLNFHDEIKAICKPLERLGITYFGHAKLHANGHVTGVSNNPGYFQLYLEEEMFDLDLHTEVGINQLGYLHWDFLPRIKGAEDYYQAHNDFNLHHEFTLIKTNEEATDLYHFATATGDSTMNTFYVQHLGLLEKFISYYNDAIQENEFLNKSHQLVIPVNNVGKMSNLSQLNHLTLPNETIKDFLASLGETDYVSDTSLSPREKQCLTQLARGSSAKVIGRNLALSPKTIYFYLDNIKKKLNCYSKQDLVQYYWNHLLHER